MRLYREDKGFFLIKQNLQFQNLSPSQVNIEQPLDAKSFVEEQGSSEFIKVYAGNTYRTVKTDRPMELPLGEGMSTTTWDFYKKNGDYFAQMSLFVSLNQNHKGLKDFSKIFARISFVLEEKLPSVFNNIKIEPDYYKNSITPLLKKVLQSFSLNIEILNVTVVMNFFQTQKFIQSLPDNCSIYVKDSLEENFVFHTNQCFVLTKNELLHLKKESTPKEGFTKSVVKCKNFKELQKKIGESKLNSGLIPNVPESRIGVGTSSNNNLQTIINFIPSNTHKTVIYNSGSHMIRVSNPLKPDETRGLFSLENVKEMKYETVSSCVVKYFVENEILLIETAPFFSNDNKEVIEFNNIKTQLILKAENGRKQAISTWQPPAAQAWLLLVSRLWLFQDGLESQVFTRLGPIEPLYICLHQASLKNLNKLIKALKNTQSSADDNVELKEEHLVEIEKQWSAAEQELENKNQTINWRQAFRHKNSEVAVENGGPFRVLAMQPVNHAIKLHNFLAVPFTSNIKKVLDSRSVSCDFLDVPSAIITSCKPSMIHNRVLSDTVREFFYQENKSINIYNNYESVSAKLTVVYSPIYTEHDGWAQEAEENRELISKALSTKVFENIDIFLEYWNYWGNQSDYLSLIRERLGDILTKKPFNQIQASLLFCLTVKKGDNTMRFLTGIGSGVALAFPKNSPPIIKIHAMYDANDLPVSLDSLIKPIGNEPKLLSDFLPSPTRIQESLQIEIVKDPETEILLLSGRDFTYKSLKYISTEKNLDFHRYAPDIKVFEKDEKENPIVRTMQALRPLRKELLEITANPDMQSAWVKIKALLEVKNDQVPLEEEMKLVKSVTNAFKLALSTTVLSDSFTSMFKKGSLVTKEEEKKSISETSDTSATKIKSVSECIHFEQFIDECQQLAESKTSLKLTSQEIEAVGNLWRIAVDEARPFSIQGEEDDSSEIFISWENIRKKYFPYFQGANDSMVVIAPTCTIEPPKFFEYIYGLAQQNSYLSSQHNKEEAKEILIFAHVLCSLQDDITILGHIRAKFISLNTQIIDEHFCYFWRQLEKLLIFLYAPNLQGFHHSLYSLSDLICVLPENNHQVSTLSSNNTLVTSLVSGVGALGFRVHQLPDTGTTSTTTSTTGKEISTRSPLASSIR